MTIWYGHSSWNTFLKKNNEEELAVIIQAMFPIGVKYFPVNSILSGWYFRLYLKKYHTHQFIAVILFANGSALVLVMTWASDGPSLWRIHVSSTLK